MLTDHDSSKMFDKKHNRKKKEILEEIENVQPNLPRGSWSIKIQLKSVTSFKISKMKV
jgi:hypothetical protein